MSPRKSNAPVKKIRVLSLGAGVQSSTLYLMAVHGEFGDERPSVAIFADTQWEPAAVYKWLDELERIGGAIIPIHRITIGSIRADAISRPGGRFASMPLYTISPRQQVGRRLKSGKLRRQCTREYKVTPVTQHVRRALLGLKPGRPVPPTSLVEMWMGISTDEASRMKDARAARFVARHPLIDRRMSRRDCVRWLAAHGYDEPPKSACIGCPFTNNARWREMKRDRPTEFADAVAFDRAIRDVAGSQPAFLHRSLVPLDEASFPRSAKEDRLNLFENECEGMCGV